MRRLSIFLDGKIRNLLKCKHDQHLFLSNVYGDNINRFSTSKMTVRSIWMCTDCNKIIKKPDLYRPELDFRGYTDKLDMRGKKS